MNKPRCKEYWEIVDILGLLQSVFRLIMFINKRTLHWVNKRKGKKQANIKVLIMDVLLILIFFPLTPVSCSPGNPLTHSVLEDDLEHLILLPPPIECWDCRSPPPCLVYRVLGIEARAVYMLRQHSIN